MWRPSAHLYRHEHKQDQTSGISRGVLCKGGACDDVFGLPTSYTLYRIHLYLYLDDPARVSERHLGVTIREPSFSLLVDKYLVHDCCRVQTSSARRGPADPRAGSEVPATSRVARSRTGSIYYAVFGARRGPRRPDARCERRAHPS